MTRLGHLTGEHTVQGRSLTGGRLAWKKSTASGDPAPCGRSWTRLSRGFGPSAGGASRCSGWPVDKWTALRFPTACPLTDRPGDGYGAHPLGKVSFEATIGASVSFSFDATGRAGRGRLDCEARLTMEKPT